MDIDGAYLWIIWIDGAEVFFSHKTFNLSWIDGMYVYISN
jgi:hypothetical protein